MLPTVDAEGRATIGPEWLQGRTAYGGVSAAIALIAVKAAFPDLPPLRSVQVAFVGPLAGDVAATPQLLRRGKNSAFVACDVANADGVGLRALFLFMAPRASTVAHDALPMPAVTAIAPTAMPPGVPQFLTKFEVAEGASVAAGFVRWVRLRDRDALDPEVELVAIADALPPAALTLATMPGPVSTVTWQLNILGALAAAHAEGWWLLAADTLHAADGGSSQSMMIWCDGRAVATATQSVALFL